MKQIIRKYKMILIALVLYGMVAIFNQDVFLSAVNNTWRFLIEMIQVLPPVLIISALITVWVPSAAIRKGLGQDSGLRGKLLSLIIGSVSAGPIYAAFPVVLVLFKKGASVSNVVVILSSWAVIKIPMILVETSFLGAQFMATRVLLTVPAILLMGFFVEALVKREHIQEKSDAHAGTAKDILTRLPNIDCGACGFTDCRSFAEAVFRNEREVNQCVVLQKQGKQEALIQG